MPGSPDGSGLFLDTKTSGDPLGFRPSVVYNRTNTGRRETGEFFDKLAAEVWGGRGRGYARREGMGKAEVEKRKTEI